MQPGRELDALIAEKVMGLTRLNCHSGDCFYRIDIVEGKEKEFKGLAKPYSTDIAAAWEVVEAALLPRVISISWCDGWEITEYLPDTKENVLLAHGEQFAATICLAALAAVSSDRREQAVGATDAASERVEK